MSKRRWEFASDTVTVIELENPYHPSEKSIHPTSTTGDVDAAVAAARSAAELWRARTPLQRAQTLKEIGEALRSAADELADLMLAELGKPIPDGVGEVANAANVFDYYAAIVIAGSTQTGRSLNSSDQLATLRYPLGVVAAVTPWNFPVNLGAVKLAPALAFGNAVVLKPSPQAVRSTQRLVQALYSVTSLPDGLVCVVHGIGGSVVDQLIRHDDIAAITFTGSTAVGRQILASAAKENVKAQCEMGGSNAAVVLADADIPRAVSLVVDGAFRLAGQRCTATSRVIVEASIYDEFTRQLVEATRAVRFGDPAEEGVLVGPLVNSTALEAIGRSVDAAVEEGAVVLCGGGPSRDSDGYVFEPTVLEVKAGAAITHLEVFGPVLTIQSAADLREAIELVNDSPYGLSAAISTKDLGAAQRFIDGADAGAVSINGSTAGWQYQNAFGGWKDSGAGIPEQGPEAELFYTRQKTVRSNWANS